MLRALANYYDCLREQKDSNLVPDGYSNVGINYMLVLTSEGKIKQILEYANDVTIGKKIKKEPRTEIFPFRNKVTGIAAETIDHREKYNFGLEFVKPSKDSDSIGKFEVNQSSKLAFEKNKEINLAFLEDLSSPVINAYKAFLKNWIPENECENPILLEFGKDYTSAKFVIAHESDLSQTLNKDKQVKTKWDIMLANRAPSANAILGQCSISGAKNVEIARIHNNLSGVLNGASTGVNIVCCKTDAFWSYGKSKSYNSSVSKAVMQKYVDAFNYLTASKDHKQFVGDMTLLFWAQTAKNENDYAEMFSCACFSNGEEEFRKQK